MHLPDREKAGRKSVEVILTQGIRRALLNVEEYDPDEPEANVVCSPPLCRYSSFGKVLPDLGLFLRRVTGSLSQDLI